MATAYWCILIAALLPYLWVGVAKSAGQRYDNRDPRGWLARQDHPRVARANGAQLNAWEAFAPFAASVLMAQAAGVPHGDIGNLAIAFIVVRGLHGLFYVSGHHYLRSLAWAVGMGIVVTLMVKAAGAVA